MKLLDYVNETVMNKVIFNNKEFKYIMKGDILIFQSVWLGGLKLKSLMELPWSERKWVVDGDFACSYNQLTDLKGCPKIVRGDFDCRENNLESLDGAPEMVHGSVATSGNPKLKEKEKEVQKLKRKYRNIRDFGWPKKEGK